jgi:hypothetical protein
MLPLKDPPDVPVIRTYIVVEATLPLDAVRVIELPNVPPLVVETSYPVGAVTVIFPAKPLPDTV